MLVFSRTKINPLGIKQAIIKNEEEMTIYPAKIKMKSDQFQDILILRNYSYATCKIDLTNVPSGFYRIIFLFYNNMHYKIKNMVPFGVQLADSEDNSNELIHAFTNNITQKN